MRERALTGQRSAVPSHGAALRLRASWLMAAIRARVSRVLPDTGAPVPQRIIDQMLDIMPSPRLVIHEYRKHGTCSGLDPAGYYDLSRRLYEKINIPKRFRLPAAPFFISPQQVVDEFIDANPGLKVEMLTVDCRGSGNRLREVRICFSREGHFRPCGSNERRAFCRANRMYVPPVRVGGGAGTTKPQGQRAL